MKSQNKQSNFINYQTIFSKQLYLNSKDADIFMNKTMKSQVVFFFTDILKRQRNTIETRVSIVNAQIPVSWYLINSTNNTFKVTVNSVTTAYTFPVGNYRISTFITAFQTLLGSSWNVTFDSIKEKFTFTNSNTVAFVFTDSGSNSLLPLMGFSIGSINISTVISSSSSKLVSQYPVNFGGLTRINIKSPTFNIHNLDANTNTLTRTLCSVPVTAIQNGYIFYTNVTGYKNVFKNHEVSNIQIDITDDQNNPLDFQNIDWTLTLQIDVVDEIVESLDTLDDVYLNLTQEE
jgi:hypothetical protein